jgi:aminopeptidase
MTPNFEQNLEKYAEVIVKVGLNIQPGQRLVIGPPMHGGLGVELENASLVRLIAKKAYQAGARLVDVMWVDDQLELLRLQHAPRDSFDEYPTWRADGAIEAAKAGDALLFIFVPNHFLFEDQDQNLANSIFKARGKHMKPFLDLRGRLAMSYVVAAGVSDGWANIVIPEVPPEDRKSQLWEMVFEICRINQPDPVLAWQQHITELGARCEYLNNKHYASLHFTALGTDLRTGLPEGHIWKGGSDTNQSGINFTANIPTEEIFTLPHSDKVEGVVISTKPMGLIEGLTLTFSEGKVVKATARKGEKILHNLLERDDRSRQLGEVALVPHSSPISQSGWHFQNLLFDENAACHLALGNAYRHSILGGENMSDQEFMQAGGNNSRVHVDFMIGSGEMDVDGVTQDGSIEPVMRNGEWVFDI